jgi:ABC-2 type transport system ATP-binding protein
MPEAVIEINGLGKNFGAVQAVRNLELTVYRGEMFSIVGPDGAGKTTTIRMLCGVMEPSAGQAKILGFDLRKDIEEIRKRIGYLSQRFSLYGDLTVDENIEFFAEINEVRDYLGRRNQLLEFTRLATFRKRLAEKLSGGMKQKLALACTLIHTPEIIFLDEPTTGVDPVSRRDFWKILSDLLKSNITIVMTTPYLDEAERCSRVGLMNQGAFMTVDTPQKVKAMMPGKVIEIVCDQIRKAMSVLKQAPGAGEIQVFGDRLNLAVEQDINLEELKSLLEQNLIRVLDMRVIPASLENVFISMLKSA